MPWLSCPNLPGAHAAPDLHFCLRQPHPALANATMPIWDLLFGRSMTPQERLRQHLRTLQRARRELDRERSKLETQEKQLIADIKRNARQGQMVRRRPNRAATNRAARMQGHGARPCAHSAQYPQVLPDEHATPGRGSPHANTSQHAADGRCHARCDQGTGSCVCAETDRQALGSMNRSMNIVAVQRILQEFERESSAMDMKDEMMSDAVDDAMGDAEADEMGEGVGEGEASDAILREVLDEIGVDMSQQVSPRPPINRLTHPSSAMRHPERWLPLRQRQQHESRSARPPAVATRPWRRHRAAVPRAVQATMPPFRRVSTSCVTCNI